MALNSISTVNYSVSGILITLCVFNGFRGVLFGGTLASTVHFPQHFYPHFTQNSCKSTIKAKSDTI